MSFRSVVPMTEEGVCGCDDLRGCRDVRCVNVAASLKCTRETCSLGANPER